MSAWQKSNRSFSGCFGWRQTRHQRRKHLRLVTPVVAERKLVNVVLEILPADAVVRPVNGTLYLAPKAFNRVRVYAARDVFTSTVVDALVRESELASHVVNIQFIGDDRCGGFHILADMADGGVCRDIYGDFGANLSPTFNNADHWRLASSTTAPLALTLAPDVGFVRFHH